MNLEGPFNLNALSRRIKPFILLSFNKASSANYNVKISAGEAFAARLNSVTGDNLHVKSSAGVLEVELVVAK